jgi:hypothetical protein
MNIFIACAKSKVSYPCEAQELYSASSIFNKRLEYALNKRKELKEQVNIYILSAKYGLLNLTDKIVPYDMFLATETKEYKVSWAIKVLEQMKAAGIDMNDNTYFAAGEEYWERLISFFPNATNEKTEVEKLLGRGGIGMAMHYYDIINKKDSTAPITLSSTDLF